MSLLSELRNWRNNQARMEGVEGYRVLSNTVLEALVGALPRSRDEMLSIKGIKEAKYSKYGTTLLRMIAEHSGSTGVKDNVEARLPKKSIQNEGRELSEVYPFDLELPEFEPGGEKEVDQTLSVSQFLDGLNIELSGMAGRIRGEVSSVDVRERVVYFTIKDSQDESTLACLIFRNQYNLSGVNLAIGDEVIVEGAPDIYKPNGRLSLKVGMIELCGEGALKKAYDALKQKLETEGIFALEKKRPLPLFPERIALITSEQGAAIGDFTMNLGPQGFKVDFYPTSVEGKKAVIEILEAVRYFNRHAKEYDVLVMIRGGGSLESLQAFNNETLIREIADCKIPTLLGVGHEKDITLSALAADVMVSTPTATARTLREPWDEARGVLRHFEQQLPTLFERELSEVKNGLAQSDSALLEHLNVFLDQAERLKFALKERFFLLQSVVKQQVVAVTEAKRVLARNFSETIEEVKKQLLHDEELLRQYDPKRVLKLGYSLVQSRNRVVKDIDTLKLGDILEIQFSRGSVVAEIEKIIDPE
ncbi:MAG: exodeoxyribonuclease VII large subunit [Candidatus Moranbacteria bacterium]|nr:exodeoxyribonuclease VII large subunit [Candidatus Moranbacteria bacterium]